MVWTSANHHGSQTSLFSVTSRMAGAVMWCGVLCSPGVLHGHGSGQRPAARSFHPGHVFPLGQPSSEYHIRFSSSSLEHNNQYCHCVQNNGALLLMMVLNDDEGFNNLFIFIEKLSHAHAHAHTRTHARTHRRARKGWYLA